MRLIRKSQSATEYAIFIAAVLVGLLALQVYYSRAVKGNVKSRADSIGEQLDTKDGYTLETRSVSSRTSDTGYNGTSGSWSNSTIDSTGAGTSEIDAITEGTNNRATLLGNNYQGGEVSQTDYVQEGSLGGGMLGAHGTATTGNFSNTGVSVYNDTGAN
jgi:Flp pilus assembly pilin Flp